MKPLVGHQRAMRQLESAVITGRLGHAYLFAGPGGVGKHTAAMQFAQSLLCESDREVNRKSLAPCGSCNGCKMVAAGTHPDLIATQRPDDKVDFPIDTIRDFIDQLTLKPVRGSYRVGIVRDAEDLTTEAANAFLKTLEEPPPGSVLLLVASGSPEGQLPTIRSRCQVVAFSTLTIAEVEEVVRSLPDVEVGPRFSEACRSAAGRPGVAVELLDDAVWAYRELLMHIVFQDKPHWQEFLTETMKFIDSGGSEPGRRRRRSALGIQLFAGVVNDAIRSAHDLPPASGSAAETGKLKVLANRVGVDRLLRWTDHLFDAEQGVDRKLILEWTVERLALRL